MMAQSTRRDLYLCRTCWTESQKSRAIWRSLCASVSEQESRAALLRYILGVELIQSCRICGGPCKRPQLRQMHSFEGKLSNLEIQALS